jgi:CHAT domain-containing protein
MKMTGRADEAEPLIRRTLEIREAKLGKDHWEYSKSLAHLGRLYHSRGQYAEAEPLLRRSLEIRQRALGKEHAHTAILMGYVGSLYQDMGRYDDAEPLLRGMLEVREAKQGKDNDYTTRSRNALAALYATTGRLAEARATFDQARRSTRRFVTELLPTLSQEQRGVYLQGSYVDGTSADALSDALSLGLRHGTDPQTAEHSATWLANGKAVQHEAQALAAQLQSINDPQARPIAEQLRGVRERLIRLKLETPAKELFGEPKKQLDALESQDRELTTRLQQLGGRAGRAVEWTELAAIRRALPPRGVLIDIARLEVNEFKKRSAGEGPKKPAQSPAARYVAWVTPPQGTVRVIDLGEAAALEALVADAQKVLASAAERVKQVGEAEAEKALREKARALAQRVVDPLLAVEEVKSAEHWVVSPDGGLWLVPWAALVLPDGKYVAEQYLVRTVTAARDLAAPADARVAASSPKVSPPLIVADPDFDLTRAAAASKARELTGRATEEQAGSALSEGLKLGRIARLPGTAAEAELIAPRAEELSKQAPRVHTGQQALEAVVKAARQPRLLVLSTHGFFLEAQETHRGANPEFDARSVALTKEGKRREEPLLRCGLLLAACNDQPRPGQTRPGDDGVLTGLEVVGLDLRGCELVVLSACETGLGDVRNGEGVAGLRQAFQLAGAQSVVATLWQIPDRDSALLMSDFFDHLAKGRGKAAALREAQLARIKARRERSGAAHPLFWAAFTLTGLDAARK